MPRVPEMRRVLEAETRKNLEAVHLPLDSLRQQEAGKLENNVLKLAS